MRNISDKIVEKIKTHIVCSLNFFSENRAVEKYCGPREPTDDSLTTGMHLACWIIMAAAYTHSAYELCNIYCFFAVTMLKRTCLKVECIPTLPALLKLNFAFGVQVMARVVSRWPFCQLSRNKDKRN
jgi:hypothetical protein